MKALLHTVIGCSALLALAIPMTAQAQSGRRVVVIQKTVAPPLTVNRRSWLDMGTAAEVGTTDRYVAQATTLHEPIYASYLPDRFGRSTLPRQFTLPFEDNPRGPESGGIFFDRF